MPYLMAASFLVLSGLASLTYQVVWVRLLGLSMGSTSASISTVLAAFFLGMAAGSLLAERLTKNRLEGFSPYIVLEVLIGVSGLVLLPILLNLDQFMAWLPAAGTSLLLKFIVAIALLSIPTLCMGATFPVMAAILVRHHSEVGLRMSQLYALNTAGAVLGAGLCGFVFIPLWGLDGAVYIAVALNAMIVGVAVYFNRRVVLPPLVLPPTSDNAAPPVPVGNTADRARALVILAVTGFAAIATQVGWTKYLGIFTGTTLYGFSAILTVFLIGIASGSWTMRKYVDRIHNPQTWLIGGLVLLGLSLLISQAGLTLIPNLYGAVNHLDFGPAVVLGAKYIVVFAIVFVPTFLFGALFPLNIVLYCGGLAGVRSNVGKAYAVNTLASIFGALAAGFWIIPTFGTAALLTSMALIVLVSILVYLPNQQTPMARAALASLAIATMAGSAWFPRADYKDLIASVQYRYDVDALQGKTPEITFLKEGKAGVISMVTYDGKLYKLQNNGLNEAVVDPSNPNNALLIETLLGLVPYFLNDTAKTGFIVGFGGGTTARALTLTGLESIRVVELEPAVIDAGRAIYHGEIPALKDPRVKIEFNDARNTLLVEDTKYDIIAAQPSHPWVARASSVFTLEFWETAKSRLNDGGVFGQWVNLFNMNASTLQSIYKAFYTVFPHGVSFANFETGDLLLFGATTPIRLDYESLAGHIKDPQVREALAFHQIDTPDDLLWYLALSRREALAAAADAEPNTDTNILSEVRLSALVSQPDGAEDPYQFLKGAYTLDVADLFGEDAKERFYGLARYAINYSNYFVANKALNRLAKYDKVLARSVRYEEQWHRYRYAEATALYDKHGEWPPRVHLLQALALANQERAQEAPAILERISDERERRAAQAQLHYRLKNWEILAGLTPMSDEEQKWQTAALIELDPVAANLSIENLTDERTDDIALLRTLVKHFSANNDAAAMEHWARRLVKVIDEESERLATLTRQAINDKKLDTASLIFNKLEHMNPDSEELAGLRQRLASQGAISLAQSPLSETAER